MGNAEAVQDAVQAVGELLSSESYRWRQRPRCVSTGWQHLVRHSGVGQIDDPADPDLSTAIAGTSLASPGPHSRLRSFNGHAGMRRSGSRAQSSRCWAATASSSSDPARADLSERRLGAHSSSSCIARPAAIAETGLAPPLGNAPRWAHVDHTDGPGDRLSVSRRR